MSIDVFNRYEKKFVIDQLKYESLIRTIENQMTLDKYNVVNGFYTISNLYFDTPSNALIRKSLSKPIYKEKLRLRAYGVPNLESEVFLEIKKKFNGKVNKRRTTLMLDEAYAFLDNNAMPCSKPYHNRQVLKEISFMLQQYDLEPTVYIAYDRQAFFSDNLRVTFDQNIRTRRHELRLECGDYGTPILEEGKWVMEVKTDKALPLWLAKLMSSHELYPASFSKYGREFQITELKGAHFTCLNLYSPLQQVVR